jgi:hypothetical protein
MYVFKILQLFLHHRRTTCFDQYGHHRVPSKLLLKFLHFRQLVQTKVHPRLCAHVLWCICNM